MAGGVRGGTHLTGNSQGCYNGTMRDINYGQEISGVAWHKIDERDGCWVWTGKLRSNGQPAHMHRVLLEAATGESYAKSRLLCEERRCVNPRHREWYGVSPQVSYWVCSAEECLKPVSFRGLCSMHGSRVKRGNPLEPEEVEVPPEDRCSWADCKYPRKNAGLCSTHYRRQRKGVDMDKPIRARYAPRQCSLEGCDRVIEARGLCSVHYVRERKGKDLHAPIRKASKDYKVGDTYLNEEGYVMVVTDEKGPRRHMREHRFLMEKVLGRELLPEETVHHINGVRDDNRLENLELWSSSHPPGQRVKDKVEWAKEILALYQGGQ